MIRVSATTNMLSFISIAILFIPVKSSVLILSRNFRMSFYVSFQPVVSVAVAARTHKFHLAFMV